jgi:membrane protease YdiL (CAAX protease family)
MAACPLRSRAVSGPREPTRARPEVPPGGFIAVVAGFVGGNVAALFLLALSGARVNSAVYNTVGVVGLWVGFVGVPVYVSRTFGTGRLSTDFGLRLGGPSDIGLGLVSGVGSYLVIEGYTRLIRAAGDHANFGHEAQQLSGHGLGIGFVVFAATVVIGAPFAEELYFRGLTQPVLQRYLGGWAGLLVTSVFFGLAHAGSNPGEAIPALAFFGVVLGLLAWRTGRLGPGIVAHMTFNGITVVALALSR